MPAIIAARAARKAAKSPVPPVLRVLPSPVSPILSDFQVTPRVVLPKTSVGPVNIFERKG